MVKFINCFLEDAELQSQKLIPILKLPHPKQLIHTQQTFVPIYIATDF